MVQVQIWLVRVKVQIDLYPSYRKYFNELSLVNIKKSIAKSICIAYYVHSCLRAQKLTPLRHNVGRTNWEFHLIHNLKAVGFAKQSKTKQQKRNQIKTKIEYSHLVFSTKVLRDCKYIN